MAKSEEKSLSISSTGTLIEVSKQQKVFYETCSAKSEHPRWSISPITELRDAVDEEPYPEDLGDFLDEEGAFGCIACGACCYRVEWTLPEWVISGTRGRCAKLHGTECSIYEARPIQCRLSDYAAALNQSPSNRTLAAACSHMRRMWLDRPTEDSE